MSDRASLLSVAGCAAAMRALAIAMMKSATRVIDRSPTAATVAARAGSAVRVAVIATRAVLAGTSVHAARMIAARAVWVGFVTSVWVAARAGVAARMIAVRVGLPTARVGPVTARVGLRSEEHT